MRTFFKKINKNYGFEIIFFNKIRKFSDGLTILNHNMNWDRYESDHSPRFEWFLTILNIILFELSIYYLYHQE